MTFSAAYECFRSKINKHGPIHSVLKTRCWLWTAACFKDGYGAFGFEGKIRLAHIVAWYVYHGEWPGLNDEGKQLEVCHRCDNPPCVRGSHLFLGTHKENVQDMLLKGRANKPKCSKHWSTDLTEKDVAKIRKLYVPGVISQREIAEMFDVDQSTISLMLRHLRWQHI